jgi:hypothetical protein
MPVRERLHCQVDPFMSLEIVVTGKGLRALVTFVWPVVLLSYIRVCYATVVVYVVDEVLLSWLRERLLRGVHSFLLSTGRNHGGKEVRLSRVRVWKFIDIEFCLIYFGSLCGPVIYGLIWKDDCC